MTPPAETDATPPAAPASEAPADGLTGPAKDASTQESDAPRSAEPAPADEPGPTPPPRRDLRRVLRRFGPAVVAIGIAIFASPLAERWPSSQIVEVALETPAEVTRVSLAVVPHGEQDPVFEATWNFDAGDAPPRIQAKMATPNGPYDASIVVSRRGGEARDETKHVELDGNRLTLFAR